MKKEEGKAFDLNTEETTQKVLEVGTSTNETKIDDKTSFENFKVLYDGRIKEKCLADYGTVEDKELLEDTAKELYLTSQELIPDEDTKSEGDLEAEKTKQEESVKLTERVSKELVDKMDKNEFTDLYYFSEHIDDIEKVIDNCTDKSKIKQYKEILKAARAFKSGRTKTEALSNESKFLAHILNGVISDVQSKFNVIATGELDTADKNKVAVTLKGSTLDLIDATSYLAKAIRRDDVDFTFDDEIKNNTVRCVISPKTKTESKDNEGSEYDYMLLSRLKSDCDYFLGNGNRYEKHLWAGNVDDQIAKMKELYNKLPEKPEWLTMEDIENYEKEMKQDVKTESRDRVAENLPKFVYDLTKSDFDKYGETAWTASEPKKDNNGRTVYEVYRNGKSDFKIADVVAEIQKEFPELKLSLQSTAPGDRVFFVKETKKQESQSTEVGYNEFTEDMEEIERTINFIKEPKNKDAKEVLDDIKEFLNKLWADKEQNTFGIKYAENKKIEESVKDENTEIQNDILDYMLAECDFKVYSDGKAEVTYIPDLDDVQRYVYEDATQEDVDKISKQLENLITNARFYKEDGELYIQLNDNRTLYDIDNDNVDEQLYNDLLEPYFDAFEEDTGVQLYQAGRSGRHIVVKFNLENLENYDSLKSEQEKQEQAFIEEVNNYGKEEESKDVEEPNTNKIDNIVAQLMEELPDFAQGYRDIIMELGLSKEDFIDMITTENEHQLLKDKNITEDEEKEVYGKIYDTLV